MPFWLHCVVAVCIIVIFLYKFIKEKKVYQLLFVLWAPLTLLTYLSQDKTFQMALGIIQIVLFLAIIYLLFKRKRPKLNFKGENIFDKLEEMDKQSSEQEDKNDKGSDL
ncbi:MAG: hypothetical protein RSE07_00540 [Oscillospiraceae bacterium]